MGYANIITIRIRYRAVQQPESSPLARAYNTGPAGKVPIQEWTRAGDRNAAFNGAGNPASDGAGNPAPDGPPILL